MPRLVKYTFLIPLVLFACGVPDRAVELYSAPVSVDVAALPLVDGELVFEVTLANTGTGDGEITTLAIAGEGSDYLTVDPNLELPLVLAAGTSVQIPIAVGDLSTLPEGWFEAPLSLDASMASTWSTSGCNGSSPSSDTLSVPITLARPLGCDDDGDGFTSAACGGDDCNDASADAFPGAFELCDGIDNDCDGVADGGDALDAVDWFLDGDGDGYGAGDPTRDCERPDVDWLEQDGDCDDDNGDVNPDATEVCNDIDDDCDNRIDDADSNLDTSTGATFYADRDGDTFGDPNSTVESCVPPTGYVSRARDCDDRKTFVNPDADESCVTVAGSAIDEDCDGRVDEAGAIGGTRFFADRDGDLFGDARSPRDACTAPVGFVLDDTDCNDRSTDVYPGAPELCNGVSDDCDAAVDEDAGDVYYADRDGDSWGSDTDFRNSCSPVPGFVLRGGDCDDGSFLYNPDREDRCDDLEDYNCDGAPEDGCTSCAELLADGVETADGVYSLDLDADGDGTADQSYDAYCDMTTDGGGWTLVQRTVWEWSETSQLQTGFSAWADGSVGTPSGGGAYRLPGGRWPGLAPAGDLMVVERIRTEIGGACDPLFYVATGGLLTVDSASQAVSFTGLTQPASNATLASSSLSTTDSGSSASCVQSRRQVPWFYGNNCGCVSCPSMGLALYWSDEPHPMSSLGVRVDDLNGLRPADVCTAPQVGAEDGSNNVGMDSMEHYLR